MLFARSISKRIGWRLALYSALLFCGLALVLGLIAATLVTHALDRQIDRRIIAEMTSLKDIHTKTGEAGLIEAILRRTNMREGLAYRLQSESGSVLAGTLAAKPAAEGWSNFSLNEDDAKAFEASDRFRALSATLNSLNLTVAQDTDDLEDVQTEILRAFTLVGIFASFLSALGGAGISRYFLYRLGALGAKAEEITLGAHDLRMTTNGSGDEFDSLSDSFNRVLERNSNLLARQKRISSDIAHDLRTPLTKLKQSLEAATISGSQREKLLGEVDGILSTFNALLRISEIEEGSRKAGFKTCDFSALMLDVAEAYMAEFEDEGRQFNLIIEPGVVLQGDPDLLKQLAANGLENILHHTPNGTSGSITVEKKGNCVVLAIADTGPGIAKTDINPGPDISLRLTKDAASGHGFGLKLITAIADLHSGNVMLSDAEPGLIATIKFEQKDRIHSSTLLVHHNQTDSDNQ